MEQLLTYNLQKMWQTREYIEKTAFAETPRSFLEGPSANKAPMINEIAVHSLMTTNSAGYELVIELEFECWNPFVWFGGMGQDFNYRSQIQYALRTRGGNFSFPAGSGATGSAAGGWRLEKPCENVFLTDWKENRFQVGYATLVMTAPAGNDPVAPEMQIEFVRYWSAGPGRFSGNPLQFLVDQAPVPSGSAPYVSILSQSVGSSRVVSFQTDDPRLNYIWLDHWEKKEGSVTVGNQNEDMLTVDEDYKDKSTTMFLPGNRYQETGQPLYVLLKNLSELGHLLYDEQKPWQTIPLVGKNALPVFEYFTLETNDVPGAIGRINVNTHDSEVLSTVLGDIEVVDFPDAEDAVTVQVDDETALKLADVLKGKNKMTVFESLRETSYDEIMQATGLQNKWAVDCLIGRFYRLLGARQNTFVILVAAQAVKDGSADVLGEKAAVFYVWRDPRLNSNEKHEYKVLFFKILE
jgi:hypothetical protein